MCSKKKPKVQEAAPPPPPPPPPPPKIVSPEEAPEDSGTTAVSADKATRTARSRLRIDLGTGGSSSGLGIPTT